MKRRTYKSNQTHIDTICIEKIQKNREILHQIPLAILLHALNKQTKNTQKNEVNKAHIRNNSKLKLRSEKKRIWLSPHNEEQQRKRRK